VSKSFFALALLLAVPLCFMAYAQEEEDSTEYAKKVQEAIAKVAEKVSPAFVNFGGGSGICVSPEGLIVTNNHVAGRSANWTVRMPGGPRGKSFKAKMLWKDPRGDIALLQLDTKGEKVPCIEMGDSDKVRVGEFAIALGTPFMTADEDSVPTVTFGVISAVHRNFGGYSDAIQTDAPVNPGNSGGPLIDLEGRLLGINGQIRVRFPYRVNTGIGLAVPTNQIRKFMEAFKDVKDGSDVYHGQITGLTLKADDAATEGALVEQVASGSTAEKAGFKPNDLVVKIDEYKIFSHIRFHGVIGIYPEKSTVEVVVLRDGEEHKLKVALDRAGDGRQSVRQPGPQARRGAYLGVKFSSVPNADGVQVETVVPGGPSDKAGLKAGDVITQFDGKKVENIDDIRKILQEKKPGDKIKVEVLRDGESQELDVELGKIP
jgi:serine protease Do